MKCYKYIKITSIVLILLIIIMSLIACNKDTTSIDNLYKKIPNKYQVKEFDFPDNFYYISYNISFDECVNIYGYLDSGYVQLKYNLNGELLDNTNISEITGITAILLTGLQSNGNYVIINSDTIYLTSPDGKIITKNDYVNDYNYYLYISETDAIYLTMGSRLYVFDKNLDLITEVESQGILSIIFSDEDDNIIIKNFSDNTYSVFDYKTKSLKKYEKITLPQNSEFYSGVDNNSYILNDKGIYLNNEVRTILLSWESSNIPYTRTRQYTIINEDVILCELKDYFDSFHKPVILKHVSDDEVEEKVIIKLAIMGYDNVGIIKEAVDLFNRNNKTYHIETIDYSIYNKAPTYEQGIDELNKDLTRGDYSDIVMIHFTMFESFDTYTDKNVFTDLTEALKSSGHKLLKSVETSYFSGDKIYQIPIFMLLDSMLTKSSIINKDEPFTLDKLYSLAENIKNNEALFSKYIDILSTALYDFIDYKNKTCNFESDGFIKLLEFQKNIYNYIDKDKGAINNFSNNYFLTSDKIYGSLANEELYFLELPFDKLAGYMLSKICYGDDEFTICGYPNSTGNASNFFTEYTFGITEQSKVKNGAWEFIEFLLSDTIQNSEILTSYGLPVTVNGIEKLIDTYSEYYLNFSQTDSAMHNEYTGEISIYVRGVKEILPDDHMNKEFVDYVVTVTDEDKQKLFDFFNSTDVRSYKDKTVTDIVNEEYDEFYAGAISAEEAAKRIQNRVFIYLNE